MDRSPRPFPRLRRFLLLAGILALFLPVTPRSFALELPDPETPGETTVPYSLFLPVVTAQGPRLSTRLGFGAILSPISQYPEIESLRSGWYLDWRVTQNPSRPLDMEYVQVVRLHQKLSCGERFNHDRAACPYATPYDYNVYPDTNAILAAVQANPGSLWLIGNEMDRRDWPGGGQDEMLPEVYATAYHDLYALIKGADPTARVAIGGVIQATPLRLQYLDLIWQSYQDQYGETMPVDVWNVHNFILKEDLYDYGASIPPGLSQTQGMIYATDWSHVDQNLFDQQIRAFRQWMKDKGQQDKPLVVSEYGVLYRHWACEVWGSGSQCLSWKNFEDPQVVQDFMLWTFDYFLNTKGLDGQGNCVLGYPDDECRLVQSWAWYALDDVGQSGGFNRYAGLFDPTTKAITDTGTKFRDYSLANLDALSQ